jgi:hypothetical protein
MASAALAQTMEEKAETAQWDGRGRQDSLLVMAAIKPSRVDSLSELLDQIANPPAGEDFEVNPIIPFRKLRGVHFARILIHWPSPSPKAPIPEWNGIPQASGPAIPAKLLFATDFDGTLAAHIQELMRVAGPGLDAIFNHCENWPGTADPAEVERFFVRNRVVSNTFYTGCMKRSVDQIRRESELRDRIEDYLDAEIQKGGVPAEPLEIRQRIRAFVAQQNDLAWVKQAPGPFPKTLLPAFFIRHLPLTGVLAAVVLGAVVFGLLNLVATPGHALVILAALVVLLAVIVLAAYAFLSRLAAADPVIISEEVDAHTRELVTSEDRIVQNEMSSVIYIKRPLWFRVAILRGVLAFTNVSVKYLSNQGTLAGIPSIHFARWVIVDSGRRLLFFSNFDGSWENYLGDFIDKAHAGLTAVWSNCVGFPRTVGLAGEGATDEQLFKAYSRQSQIHTQVWYSAYRWLSISNINDNSRIRLGLYGDMTAEQAREWLRLF